MADIQFNQEWFSGPKAKHLLADPETAKVYIQRQALGDSAMVLHKITGLTQELMSLPDVSLMNRFAVLDLLDRHAKNYQINVLPEYLETARLRKITEGTLWTSTFEFWKSIGEAYLRCLDLYRSTEDQEIDFSSELPMLVGRIIRSLTLQFKWSLLKHERVDEALWRDLGRVYLFAESQNFATRRVTVYASRHGESSAQTELLKILMLAISGPDGLSPAYQHIAERIIAYFGDRFVLSPTLNESCNFAFDLVSGKPPSRSNGGHQSPLLVRYFGPGSALEGLAELSNYLQRAGTLPPYINVGTLFDRSQLETVIRHLERSWAEMSVPRNSERLQDFSSITVVPGLPGNLRWLSAMMAASSIAVPSPESAEQWNICDASAKGFGALIPTPSEWVAIGALLGVHNPKTVSYRMASIRRMIQEDNGAYRVGLEYLGDSAAPVALFWAAATHASDPAQSGDSAILISSSPDAHGAIDIISRPDILSNASKLQMRFRTGLHQIELVSILEETREHRLARYRLL